ncbi:hypothetical protein HELA111659_10285 [Helicobacter labetoulli]
MANICKIVFVLPPIAISTTKALCTAFAFKILRNLNFSLKLESSAISTMRLAPCLSSSSLSGVRAGIVPLPGNATPIASQSVFIEFAVNIPLQLPPLGQAWHSISCNLFSSILPLSKAPTASNAEFKSSIVPSFSCPAFIGPPLTNIVGTFTRNAPISIPGTILSQFGRQIIASKAWAFITDSIQSAISSRLGRE